MRRNRTDRRAPMILRDGNRRSYHAVMREVNRGYDLGFDLNNYGDKPPPPPEQTTLPL